MLPKNRLQHPVSLAQLKIRYLSSRLANLQIAYSFAIFFSVFTFVLEITVINQLDVIVKPIRSHSKLELFPHRPEPFQMDSTR